MKILWISHFLLYPETGYGALQRSRNLLLELSKRHDVYLLSYYRTKDLESDYELRVAHSDLEKYCKKLILIPLTVEKTRYLRFIGMAKSIFSKLPYSVILYRSEALVEIAASMIHEYKIDLIHADTLGLSENLSSGEDTFNVLNHHNIESEMMFRRADKDKNVIRKLFLLNEARKIREYEKRFCPKYDMNIVVSAIDEESLKKINKDVKTAVVENGVDCEYFSNNFGNDNRKGLIFTGRLDWYPNSDAMLFFCKAVWSHLKERFDSLTLTIIGKNPSRELLSLLEDEPDIHLKGYAPDVREYVGKAKIFVCPIRDGGGTRVKILDALAQGIPVVSTEVGCEGLSVKDEEHILVANHPNEFIEKIACLLSNEDLWNTLSMNGRRFVEEHYSFNVIGDRLSKLYEQAREGQRVV
jgi:glycosyltransferase involved in cell wall biosynthesis